MKGNDHRLLTWAVVMAALCCLTVGTLRAQAQPIPDPALWNVVNNANTGQRAVPIVGYDPGSGLLVVYSRGQNLTCNTGTNNPPTGLPNTTIGGDDVGMNVLIITGPQGQFLEPFVNPDENPVNGIIWSGQYVNGKMQLVGISASGRFAKPCDVTAYFQYAAGLTPAAFGEVQMGIRFTPNAPGGMLFGRVQFVTVPEPASMAMIGAGLALVGFARRRR